MDAKRAVRNSSSSNKLVPGDTHSAPEESARTRRRAEKKWTDFDQNYINSLNYVFEPFSVDWPVILFPLLLAHASLSISLLALALRWMCINWMRDELVFGKDTAERSQTRFVFSVFFFILIWTDLLCWNEIINLKKMWLKPTERPLHTHTAHRKCKTKLVREQKSGVKTLWKWIQTIYYNSYRSNGMAGLHRPLERTAHKCVFVYIIYMFQKMNGFSLNVRRKCRCCLLKVPFVFHNDSLSLFVGIHRL